MCYHSFGPFVIYNCTVLWLLQDPIEQTQIDNFMVQQLDGTSNEWGWCKQKVQNGLHSFAFMLLFVLQAVDFLMVWSFLIGTLGLSAWCECYSGCITCCVQSWSYGEEDSPLSGPWSCYCYSYLNIKWAHDNIYPY